MISKEIPDRTIPKTSWLLALVFVVATGMFAIALTGPPDLEDNELRIAAYATDVLDNGHWICQRDFTGDIASKPPLLTWMVALASLPFGQISRFTLYLPSALAAFGICGMVLVAGRARFGWAAGFAGAMSCLLSPMMAKAMSLSRYDALFTLAVTAAALAAFRAWKLGRGWTWFWLASAVATLVKGPLGLVLAAGGLLAVHWERRTGTPLRVRGSPWAGIALFLLVCGGWFLLAYFQFGKDLIDKMIGRELVGHAVDNAGLPGRGLYLVPRTFLVGFAPWTLASCFAFWRVCKHPSPDPDMRRFERFLFCWFFFGLGLFSIAAHQRGRLIYPLVPAAALLTGRELTIWLASWNRRKLVNTWLTITVLTLAGFLLYERFFLRWNKGVIQTLAMQQVADTIRHQWGENFPLTHVDSPFPLRFYLNAMEPLASPEQAAELLRGDYAAFVAIRDVGKLEEKVSRTGLKLHELARWPTNGDPRLRIVSNTTDPNRTNRLAALVGPILVQMRDARLISARGKEMTFIRTRADGRVVLSNQADHPQKVRLRFVDTGPDSVTERLLAPGEVWPR